MWDEIIVAPGFNRACPDSLSGGLTESPNPFFPSLEREGQGVSSSELTLNKFATDFH